MPDALGTRLSRVVRMPKHFCRSSPFPKEKPLWVTFANRHQPCMLSLPGCPADSVASNPCSFCLWENESCHHKSKDFLVGNKPSLLQGPRNHMKFKYGGILDGAESR